LSCLSPLRSYMLYHLSFAEVARDTAAITQHLPAHLRRTRFLYQSRHTIAPWRPMGSFFSSFFFSIVGVSREHHSCPLSSIFHDLSQEGIVSSKNRFSISRHSLSSLDISSDSSFPSQRGFPALMPPSLVDPSGLFQIILPRCTLTVGCFESDPHFLLPCGFRDSGKVLFPPRQAGVAF